MTTTLTLDQVNEGLQELLKLQQSTMQSIETLTLATQEIAKKQNLASKYDTNWDAFLMIEMEKVFGEQLAKEVCDTLKLCRKYESYSYLCPMYVKMTTIQNRQLLKLISAVDRIKFFTTNTTPYNRKGDSYICGLKSEIKYAKICPHCGDIASTFYNRLLKEGISI